MATVVLDERTNDRSLVMTSSFTNMVLAGRLLAVSRDARDYRARVSTLARLAADLLLDHANSLGAIARSDYRTAVYLGSGNRYGGAREAALKMLEMTGGPGQDVPGDLLWGCATVPCARSTRRRSWSASCPAIR